jgi:hypothetical protein
MSDPSTPSTPPPDGNTLYRKVTRGRRRLTRGRMLLYRIAVAIAWRLGRFMWWSCRVQRILGLDEVRSALSDSRAVILVFWHQHLLFGAKAVLDLRPDGLKPGFLISPSVDGTAPAMLVERVGGHVIRGSSTATGARALRDFYETIVKQGISPAITPDGPRGPVHEFKPGPVLFSQLSGKPIVPISIAASPCLRFRSWDRFELPLPFSRIVIAYGEPVRLPRGIDVERLPALQLDLASRLHSLQAKARAALDGES